MADAAESIPDVVAAPEEEEPRGEVGWVERRPRDGVPAWVWVLVGSVGVLAAIVIVGVVVFVATKANQSEPAQNEVPIKVSPEELATQLRQNEPRFRERWWGKLVEAEGTVERVTHDDWGLGGKYDVLVLREGHVRCVFVDPAVAPRLDPGQKIRLTGKVAIYLSSLPALAECRLK
jgi:hypothetical protein